MDELEVFAILERQGIVLVQNAEGTILGVKKSMLNTLLELAEADEDEAVFMLIQDADEPEPAPKVLN